MCKSMKKKQLALGTIHDRLNCLFVFFILAIEFLSLAIPPSKDTTPWCFFIINNFFNLHYLTCVEF